MPLSCIHKVNTLSNEIEYDASQLDFQQDPITLTFHDHDPMIGLYMVPVHREEDICSSVLLETVQFILFQSSGQASLPHHRGNDAVLHLHGYTYCGTCGYSGYGTTDFALEKKEQQKTPCWKQP